MEGDIVEKVVTDAPKPPSAPKAKLQPKKWTPRRRPVVLDPEANGAAPSVRRPAAGARAGAGAGASGASDPDTPLSDAERIHLENIRKIQKMSPEEIEREREEIFKSMNPDVLQSLLRRAEMKEQGFKGQEVKAPRAPPAGSIAEWDPSPVDPVNVKQAPAVYKSETPKEQQNKDTPVAASANTPNAPNAPNAPKAPKGPKGPKGPAPEHTSVHFPPPPEELRKYFPDLPVETEKLAWMQPVDEAEEAEYSSELASVAPSELRFDFKGNLITPRQSRMIPSSEGLHHHGDAPAAAGYTLPELAHLCRSSHNAQRAMAIQTAGRVLHKLKMKKFNRSSDLQEGLNALVMQTRILDTLAEAADERTRSLTVRTLATEALWLANSG